MLHILKNNIFRTVFAGLLLILAFTIALLPKVFADEHDIFSFESENGYEYLEDGSIEQHYSLNISSEGQAKYTLFYGYFRPEDDTHDPFAQPCAQYMSPSLIQRGDAIPEDAEVNIDASTGAYSIRYDAGMDLSEGDEILKIYDYISADVPSGYECSVAYQISYSRVVDGNPEDYEDHSDRYLFYNIYRHPQTLNYDGGLDVYYGDADAGKTFTMTNRRGTYSYGPSSDTIRTVDIHEMDRYLDHEDIFAYTSSDESVATVNSRGLVHFVGVGTATITVTAVQNYDNAEGTASYTVNVAPKPVSITNVSVPDKTYDGTTDTEVGTVTLSETGLARDVDYTVSGVLDSANVGTDRIATVTVTLIGDAANRYVLDSNTFEVNDITISPYSITSANVNLEYYEASYDGTEKEPGVTVKIGDFTVDPNEYTVSYDDNVDAGTAAVTVVAKDNMNIVSTAIRSFEIIDDRDVLEITGIDSGQMIAYTDLPVVLEGDLTVGDNTDGITVDDLSVVWYEEDGITEIEQPTDVGSYVVKYFYYGANYTGELIVMFEIVKAESPEPEEIAQLGELRVEVGKTLSEIEEIRLRGFYWEDETTVITEGRNVYRAIYIYNNDSANYEERSLEIVIYGEESEEEEEKKEETVVVPDTGRFTSTKEKNSTYNTGSIVASVLIAVATMILVGGKFAETRIDFDKK